MFLALYFYHNSPLDESPIRGTYGGKGVYMLVDTSGTYTEELDKAQAIINNLLETLAPGCDRRFNSHPIPPTLIPAKTIGVRLPIHF